MIWRGVGVVILLPLLFYTASRACVPLEAEPLLRRLGAISYPLYATHEPVFRLIDGAHLALLPSSPTPLWNLIGCAIALLTAYGMAMFGLRVQHWRAPPKLHQISA